MSARADSPFTARAVAIGVAAAVGGFLLFLVASAHAPDFAPAKRGGGNALSRSAIGYSALVRLLEDTGGEVDTVRADGDFATPELMVVTSTPDIRGEVLDELLIEREGEPTLLVLPFDEVEPLPRHRGWVRRIATNSFTAVLAAPRPRLRGDPGRGAAGGRAGHGHEPDAGGLK